MLHLGIVSWFCRSIVVTTISTQGLPPVVVVMVAILSSAATIPCPSASSDATHFARHLRLFKAREQLTK